MSVSSRTSVLMPCYETEPIYLRAAIESVLSQDAPLELIIQDGGSQSPGTREVLAGYAEDKRVELVVEQDSGQADALNRALERSRYDFVLWLNSDDILLPGALTSLLSALEHTELVGAFGDFNLIDATGNNLRHYRSNNWSYNRVFRHGCYVFSGAVLFRKKALQSAGGFDPTLHYAMDLDMYLKLGPAAELRKIDGAAAALRIHAASKTGGSPQKFAKEAYLVRRRHAQSARGNFIAGLAYLQTWVFILMQPVRFSRLYSYFRSARRLG